MKRILLSLVAIVTISLSSFGQAPEGFKYQAVVRDASSNILSNQTVGMRLTIQQGSIGGTTVYTETFAPTTNGYGLVNLEIGTGTTSDDFSTIDWANGPFYIETAADVSGGTTYVVLGTSQLMSVPYALYAKTSGNGQGPVGPAGPAGADGLLISGNAAGNTPYWDGSQWVVNGINLYNNGSNLGIGTTTPNASAITEMNSTTQGFLPPRMTTLQRDAILAPAAGLIIYNTTVNCLQWWNGTIWYDGCGNAATQPQYPAGTIHCAGATAVVDVMNPTTGAIWMDRNLGASQVATSSTDTASYGDLFQWGRRADGHQCRTSATTTTLSSIDQPGHGSFILVPSTPYDWRNPQNTNLWQGVNGVNNPCPSGYRIPTEAELEAERLSWNANSSVGAFTSPLKLPVAGYRHYNSGSLLGVGNETNYWSSTVSGTSSRRLLFGSSFANMYSFVRAWGVSVRCLKD